MVEFQALGHVRLKGRHRGCPGVIMRLGASVVERHTGFREVSHRLAFLQAVLADVCVNHPNPSQVGLGGVHASRHLVPDPSLTASEAADRSQGRTDTFPATGKVRELGGPGENEIVHATVEKLPDETGHFFRKPFPSRRRVWLSGGVRRGRAGLLRIRHGGHVGSVSRELRRGYQPRWNSGPELNGKSL
eukprot:530835-Rhodomonas_salina.1